MEETNRTVPNETTSFAQGMEDIKSLEEMYSNFKEIMILNIESLGLTKEVLDSLEIQALSVDDLVKADISEITRLLAPYLNGGSIENTEKYRNYVRAVETIAREKGVYEYDEFVHSSIRTHAMEQKEFILDTYNNTDKSSTYNPIFRMIIGSDKETLEEGDITDEMCYRALIAQVKVTQLQIHVMEKKMNDAKAELNKVAEEYSTYNVSATARANRDKMIDELKTTYATMDDGLEKSKLKRLIDVYEEIKSLSFITARLRSNPEKEVKAIIKGFDNFSIGTTVVEKFSSKISKFGYKPNVFNVMLSLEEKYLEDKYHPFNNLFLYGYMRYVGCMNPYNQKDRDLVKAYTSQICALVYKSFTDDEAEEEMKNIIREYDNFFMDYVEHFKTNNETYPLNPKRVAALEAAERKRKGLLIANLEAVDKEKKFGWDEDMRSDDLYKIFLKARGVIEDKEEEDYNKVSGVSVTTETEEDGNEVTHIVPNTESQTEETEESVETEETENE